jgi:hypothetical protein
MSASPCSENASAGGGQFRMGADVARVALDVSYRDKTGHRLNAGTCSDPHLNRHEERHFAVMHNAALIQRSRRGTETVFARY